jgi:hypothetical protein
MYVYENCSNAEKLVMTMSVQSLMTSRKSAELIAKFIYLTAHDQEMAGHSFADILSDMKVREFISVALISALLSVNSSCCLGMAENEGY